MDADFDADHAKHSDYVGFRNALASLHRRELIVVRARKLLSVHEAIREYPSRATDNRVRVVRAKLLSLVPAFLKRSFPTFSISSREDYILRTFGWEWRDKFAPRWLQAEQLILQTLLRTKAEDRREALRALWARGCELFLPPVGKSVFSEPTFRLKCAGSLEEAIALVNQRKAVSSKLGRMLVSLYEDVFPEDERKHQLLKSDMYAIVNFRSGVVPALTEEFMEYAQAKESAYLRGLPGSRDGRFPLLAKRMITRDLLSKFKFVSAAAPKAS